MSTPVIKPGQLTLDFEPGLVDRFPNLREVIATGIYKRGLMRVAMDLDVAPSNLSVKLSADPARSFSVENLEKYIAATGDKTPIYYLVEKFLSDKSAKKEAAIAEALSALAALQPLLKQAGLA